MAVDRKARLLAATAVQDFLENRIDNFDLRDRFPYSKDEGVRKIELCLWSFYSDFRSQKAQECLNADMIKLFHRCLLFLNTDVEYQWPTSLLWNLSGPLEKLWPSLYAWLKRGCKWPDGDYAEAWPFMTKQAYSEAANGHGPLLTH